MGAIFTPKDVPAFGGMSRRFGSMTGSYGVDADVDAAMIWVDAMGVGWPARKVFSPVAHVPSTSSSIIL